MWAWRLATIGGRRQNFFHRCTAKVFAGIGELHTYHFARKRTFNKDHFAARETGERIATGLALNDTMVLLAGALPAAGLALLVQLAFGAIERLLLPPTLRGLRT
jgi:hypothetical protein